MEQKTLDKVKNIINNEKVQNAFYNLYDRWEDENRYEDLNEYGKCIMNAIHKNVPESGAKLVKTTNSPFGIIFNVDNVDFHLYVKVNGGYLVLSCKLSKTLLYG
jgi:hypothetical protein